MSCARPCSQGTSSPLRGGEAGLRPGSDDGAREQAGAWLGLVRRCSEKGRREGFDLPGNTWTGRDVYGGVGAGLFCRPARLTRDR